MTNETRGGNRRAPRTPHLDALVQHLDGTVPGWRGDPAPAKEPDPRGTAAESDGLAELAALDVEWSEAIAARSRRAEHGERPHSAHYSDLADSAARALRLVADLPPGVEREAAWVEWHVRERAAVQTGDDVAWVEGERGEATGRGDRVGVPTTDRLSIAADNRRVKLDGVECQLASERDGKFVRLLLDAKGSAVTSKFLAAATGDRPSRTFARIRRECPRVAALIAPSTKARRGWRLRER